MKREDQQLSITWTLPKISKEFSDFIIKNVVDMEDETCGERYNNYHIEDIEDEVREQGFVLPPQDANFFELAKEMNVNYVFL